MKPHFLLFLVFTPILWGETITFEQAWQEARRKSPNLLISKRDMSNAVLSLKNAELQFLPKLTLTLDAPQMTANTNLASNQALWQPPQFDFGVDLTQKIPGNGVVSLGYDLALIRAYTNRFGTNNPQTHGTNTERLAGMLRLSVSFTPTREDTAARDRRLAKIRQDLARVSEAQVERSFLYDVKAAYLAWCNRLETVANERRRLSGDRQQIEVARQKFKAGIIAEYTMLDYQVEFHRSEVRLSNAERDLSERQYNFEYTLNRSEQPGLIPTPPADTASEIPNWDRKAMLTWALSNSIDVANLQLSLAQNEEALRTAKWALWPKVTFGAAANLGETNNLWNPSTTTAAQNLYGSLEIGAQISMPFFTEALMNRNALRSTENDRERLKLVLSDRVRGLANRLRIDFLNLSADDFRYRRARDNYALLEKDFELSRQRFELGAISSWETIDIKNRFYDNLNARIDARYGMLIRFAAMERDYGLKAVTW